MLQEAAQALIYAEMAGSTLENIQDKINEYQDRVQALYNAGSHMGGRCLLFLFFDVCPVLDSITIVI